MGRQSSHAIACLLVLPAALLAQSGLRRQTGVLTVAAMLIAGGVALNTTVFPFILRGVNLLGIDSVMCPRALRQEAWQRLSQDLPKAALESMV